MVEEQETMQPEAETDAKKPEVPEERKNLVASWVKKIEKAEAHYEKTAFKRMRQCMKLARDGKLDDWGDEKFVVPVLARHINLAVSQLYAKNPTADIRRRKRLLTQVWDGEPQTAMAAYQAFTQGDLNQVPLLQEVLAVREYFEQIDRLADTLKILWEHYTEEQDANFKDQLKALVRRAKINGVAYVTLHMQRMMGLNPDVTAKIDDTRSKIAQLEQLMKERQEDDAEPDDKEVEELRLLLTDLQQQEEIILREGPVFGFPKSTSIIVDPCCVHLKTLAGANWYAERFELDDDEIEEIYGVDVGDCKPAKRKVEKDGKQTDSDKFLVYKVWDKKKRQTFVIACGYEDFIEEPNEPDIAIDGFFNLFPLVFNEVESEEHGDIIPPSDVWLARHSQFEINRQRESLRQHRIANRPWYAARSGSLTEQDRDRLAHHADHEVIELSGLEANQNIDALVQRGASIPIDPAQYDTGEHFGDILRAVGSQEANLGPTSGATATESSIAENSRMSGLADQVDEIDGLLSRVVRATGKLMMLELSKETVVEIVGPGAYWPATQMSREEIAKEILLDVQANSTGKPNEAAELANLERSMPFLIQMNDVNMKPLSRKYAKLLDIDPDELNIEGMPSTVVLNQMLGEAMNAAVNPPVPAAQGPNGGANEEAPPAPDGTSQPEYPAPGAGMAGQDLPG